MSVMLLWQQEAGGVHVCARDMRMDIDAASHRNEARRVYRLVGFRISLWWRDNLLAAHPEISDFVAPIGWIKDAGAFDADQHGQAPAFWREAAIRSRVAATLGASLRTEEVAAINVPVSDEWTTAS